MDDKDRKPRYARNLMELRHYPPPPESTEPPFENMQQVFDYFLKECSELSEERKADLRIIYYELPEE